MKDFNPSLVWRGSVQPTFVLTDSKANAFYDFVQKRKGYVYAMQPPNSTLYKVGRTSKNPFLREKSLTTAGVIGEYRLKWCAEFANASWAEAEIHRILAPFNETKEFFTVSMDVLKEVFAAQVRREEDLLLGLNKDSLLTDSYDGWLDSIDISDLVGGLV